MQNEKQTPVQQLTELQEELGYVKGKLSSVALLGLVGESGEVFAETSTSIFNKEINTVIRSVMDGTSLAEELKKRLRKANPPREEFEFHPSELGMQKFRSELADVFYYLNILATNCGLTIDDLAIMAHDKVRAKMATATGSSEQRKVQDEK